MLDLKGIKHLVFFFILFFVCPIHCNLAVINNLCLLFFHTTRDLALLTVQQSQISRPFPTSIVCTYSKISSANFWPKKLKEKSQKVRFIFVFSGVDSAIGNTNQLAALRVDNELF